MRDYNFKLHWNTAYKNSAKENLGWFEDDISETFKLIQKCDLPKSSIIFNAFSELRVSLNIFESGL